MIPKSNSAKYVGFKFYFDVHTYFLLFIVLYIFSYFINYWISPYLILHLMTQFFSYDKVRTWTLRPAVFHHVLADHVRSVKHQESISFPSRFHQAPTGQNNDCYLCDYLNWLIIPYIYTYEKKPKTMWCRLYRQKNVQK